MCSQVDYVGRQFAANANPVVLASIIDNQYGTGAQYSLCRLTCTYTSPPCNTTWTNQADQGDEWRRYCTVSRIPKSQEVDLGDEALPVYVEGLFLSTRWRPGVAGNPLDFPGSPIKIVQGDVLEITWFCVPHYYLMNNNYRPVNITGYGAGFNAAMNQTYEGAVGKKNLNTFMGYAPGLLLLHDPVITPTTQPFAPFGSDWNGDQLQLLAYDVKFSFPIWDPRLGTLQNSNGQAPSTRGWGTAFWRGDATGVYLTQTKANGGGGIAGSTPLYDSMAYENLFACANATNLISNTISTG